MFFFLYNNFLALLQFHAVPSMRTEVQCGRSFWFLFVSVFELVTRLEDSRGFFEIGCNRRCKMVAVLGWDCNSAIVASVIDFRIVNVFTRLVDNGSFAEVFATPSHSVVTKPTEKNQQKLLLQHGATNQPIAFCSHRWSPATWYYLLSIWIDHSPRPLSVELDLIATLFPLIQILTAGRLVVNHQKLGNPFSNWLEMIDAIFGGWVSSRCVTLCWLLYVL